MHPTDVPARAQMKQLVRDFREISGNAIVVNKDGHTLCALFSGKFGLPPSTCQDIMDCLAAWKEDPLARIPGPTTGQPRKRSYDQRNYVSVHNILKLLYCSFGSKTNMHHTSRTPPYTMDGQFLLEEPLPWGSVLSRSSF